MSGSTNSYAHFMSSVFTRYISHHVALFCVAVDICSSLHLLWSKAHPDMTNNVFGATLNLTQLHLERSNCFWIFYQYGVL